MQVLRQVLFRVVLYLILPVLAFGQGDRTVRDAEARRVALVIGNNAYPWRRLTNAVSDASAFASALKSARFDQGKIRLVTDADLRTLQREIRTFVEGIRSGDMVLVYYSGHGVEVRGRNYLLPVDFPRDASELQVSDEGYSAQELLEKIEGSGARVKMIVLDACRDNPLRTASRGLGRMDGEGMLIMFATSAGKTAVDSGVFQRELSRGILTPGIMADEAFKHAARSVNRLTGGKQTPAMYGLLLEDFSFIPGTASTIPTVVTRLEPEAGDVRVNPKDGMRYAYVPGGKFRMGCAEGDRECFPDEKPAREVTLTKGYWMGQVEVSVEAYKRCAATVGLKMPVEPAFDGRKLNEGWANERMPMVNVNWGEARGYCEWAGGRLPTEAEWERAARGGTATARYGELEEIGWYGDNGGKERLDSAKLTKEDTDTAQTNYWAKLAANGNSFHGVGLKRPNGYRLYDILGNVWEWTGDWYGEKHYEVAGRKNPQGPPNGEQLVVRGGGWYDSARTLRASNRYAFMPTYGGSTIGFRCVWD